MSYVYYPLARPATPAIRENRSPWLVFLGLTVALFFVFHWPLDTQRTLDNYNGTQEGIIQSVAGGSPVRQVMLMVLGVLAITSLVKERFDRRLRMDGPLGWLLAGFGVWALMSSMWSEDLTLTLKRLAAFAILCIVAAAFVRRFSLREGVLWLFFASASFLIVAIVLEVTSGAFQPLATGYRFAGIQHPNGEGVECGVLLLSGLAAAIVEKRYRWVFWSFAGLGLVFLVLTKSRTSLIGTLLALTVYGTVVGSRKIKPMIVPILGILVCLVILLGAGSSITGLEKSLSLGRDDISESPDSVSGRTEIWEDVGQYIREQPVLGYGYEAFWTPAHVDEISDKEGWGVPDSHSAYLDCLLTLGAVGLILFSLSLVAGLWRVLGSYRLTQDSHFALLAGLLTFCIVNGFVESALGEGGYLTFLSLLVLFRLAFVPLKKTRPIADESRARVSEVCAV